MAWQKVGEGGMNMVRKEYYLIDLHNLAAGVAGLALPMARELAPFGIRVLGIAPGGFMTPMAISTAQLGDAFTAPGASSGFPRRPGVPPEFAFMVSHIVENPMLNGEVLRLDAAVRLH
jgi:3-hydroxyacyl-CoA dehydrogenase/3-hydroxy-2-methylbutyryl-CoA dehydrogenase